MNSSGNKLLAFEGLRGLAALVVVIWHIRLALWVSFSSDLKSALSSVPSPIARIPRAILDGLQNGNIAVWIFWVMSAVVLSLRFFANPHGTDSQLRSATLRRYPRLLVPVLGSVLLAYGLHALGLMYNVRLAQEFGPSYDEWLAKWYRYSPSFLSALKCAFWDTFFDYSNATTYNCALWTMEKEFFGSLFLFAFLSLFGRSRSRYALYPIIAVVIFMLGIFWLNAFLAGILICDLVCLLASRDYCPRWLNTKLAAIVCWFGIIFAAGLPFADTTNLIALGLSTVAVVFSLASEPSRQFLSSSVPVFLGKISFSLYLVHVPFICSYTCWAYLELSQRFSHTTAAILSGSSTFIFSIGLGYLFYLAADQWSIGISRSISKAILPEQESRLAG